MEESKYDNFILGIDEDLNIFELNKVPNVRLTEFCHVKNIIKKRGRNSHKGSYGKVGFVSGSKGMAGAAVLNLNAALRSGSGLVKAFIPDEIYCVVEAMSLEAITSCYDINNFSFEKLQREILDYSDVVASGSGCANIENYGSILDYLLKNCRKPLVLDAEGIKTLSLQDLKNHKGPLVLTPHYGEMAKLLKRDIDYIRRDILKKAMDFSLEYGAYLVLKGPRSLIACPDGQVFINTSGNPGMATAGSGDVLTGIIASLLGQGIEIKDALRTGVYLHGMAGDIGAEFLGEYSLTASDLINYLPQAIKKLGGK